MDPWIVGEEKIRSKFEIGHAKKDPGFELCVNQIRKQFHSLQFNENVLKNYKPCVGKLTFSSWKDALPRLDSMENKEMTGKLCN